MTMDVTSYLFRTPLILAGLLPVWFLSRSKYAPRPARVLKPRFYEVAFILMLTIFSSAGFWFLYSGFGIAIESSLRISDETLSLCSYFLLLILAFPVTLVLFGGTASSVRVARSNLGYSALAGVFAGAVLMGPTIAIAPYMLDILMNPYYLQLATYTSPMNFFATTLYYAFSEELFFRGLVQTRLEGYFGSSLGLAITAVASSLWHLPSLLLIFPRYSLVHTLGLVALLLPASALFGYVAQKSNNLLGSTILHVMYNLPLDLLT